MECTKCRNAIRGESGIRCEGVCGKIYHMSSKCCGMDQFSVSSISQTSLLHFICDDCMQYIHNVDHVLKDVQDIVKKNGSRLNEYKHEFDSALKTNELEIKLLLQAIEANYTQRFSAMERAQEVCEKSVSEVLKLGNLFEEMKAQTQLLISQLVNKSNNLQQLCSQEDNVVLTIDNGSTTSSAIPPVISPLVDLTDASSEGKSPAKIKN